MASSETPRAAAAAATAAVAAADSSGAADKWKVLLPSRDTLEEALRRHPPTHAFYLPYGTSVSTITSAAATAAAAAAAAAAVGGLASIGFRGSAAYLGSVAHRCGLFAGLLSLSLSLRGGVSASRHTQGFVLGAVITASHNPSGDNGLKLAGPTGCLLSAPLEALVEQLVNAHVVSKQQQQQQQQVSLEETLQREVDCFFATAERIFKNPHFIEETAKPLPAGDTTHASAAQQQQKQQHEQQHEQQQEQQEEQQGQRTRGVRGCVLHARDTRTSSAALEEAFVAGLLLLGCLPVSLGIASTGQLQFLVLLCNQALEGGPPLLQQQHHELLLAALQPLLSSPQQQQQQEQQQQQQLQELGQQLVRLYFSYLETHFESLAEDLRKANLIKDAPPLYVDFANGAGASAAAQLQQLLQRQLRRRLDARNLGPLAQGCCCGSSSSSSSNGSTCCCCSSPGVSNLINEGCGAEVVQKQQWLPQRFGKLLQLSIVLLLLLLLLLLLHAFWWYPGDASEERTCCSLDGDADRIVFFTWRRRANHSQEIELRVSDGDRVACLFLLLIIKVLKAAAADSEKTEKLNSSKPEQPQQQQQEQQQQQQQSASCSTLSIGSCFDARGQG
ncbi:hypothetical protein Emag_003284 [Eimeria magna]